MIQFFIFIYDEKAREYFTFRKIIRELLEFL